MSERSVILLEDISSSQPDTERVVRAAVSPSTFDALEVNVAGERREGVRWEIQRNQLKKAMCARRRLVRRRIWRRRTSMLFVVLARLESLDTSLSDSRYQRSFVERDLRRGVCPRASLTPLTFHNGSFQIFNIYQ